MGYRDLGDVDRKIIQTVMHMGAENGVENVSSKRIAAACGISSGTIFHRFENMRTLLDLAAQAFDRPHMARVAEMARDKLTIFQIWDDMLEYFMSDPDGTLYYISYTKTFGFDPTERNPRAAEFLEIAKIFFRSEEILSDMQYLILWDYVTSMAFYYAEKFIHGYLPYEEESKAFVKKIVFDGISDILKKEYLEKAPQKG